MKSGDGTGKGLGTCEEALERILTGKPVVPAHVGLDLSKLTASIVSREAGFDRGYLKKSRSAHLPLLARIEAFRVEASKDSGSSNAKRVERLEGKLALFEKELEMVRAQRDRVLSQNLQLWERVRELERKRPANSTCIRLPT
ncbi:TPA: hypothetical protein ACGXEA_003362 [Pseudomonas aeruginosa]|uniref:hypothetical protein n=1 Tax=Pseudomonas TaxID=286 RepID=UPI0008FB79EA|nr:MULTISPECIES: hypothetical protein [Pseudomonas]MDG0898854.1 hypothetical protein [Pseudomonas sp. L01]ELS1858414.1 hypothetical protein [Pseudomonas aeruginosa]MBH9173402.1 hypothetical protein [Pseudomonas aeruginosa]MBI8449098.1 hypothetical protein [Pseudomonas aeruginosa]MBI8523051.1 hypothetical protein [Pseudomonas aeruginosa]